MLPKKKRISPQTFEWYCIAWQITHTQKKRNPRTEDHIIQQLPICGIHFFFLMPLTHMPLAMNYGFSKFPCAVTCIVHQLLYNINTEEECLRWCWDGGVSEGCVGRPRGGMWGGGAIDYKHTLFRTSWLWFHWGILSFTSAESETMILCWHSFIKLQSGNYIALGWQAYWRRCSPILQKKTNRTNLWTLDKDRHGKNLSLIKNQSSKKNGDDDGGHPHNHIRTRKPTHIL